VNNGRAQDLTEAFANIIKMMLMTIRAQGWRSLIHLPKLCLVAIQLRRYGKKFAALMAAYEAGTLSLPAPALCTEPPDQQANQQANQQDGCAGSPAAPRLAARPDPAARDRQRPAERPSLPAADGGPDRVPAADGACLAAALPHARGQAAVRPWPPRRTPDLFAVLGPPPGVIATGRSP